MATIIAVLMALGLLNAAQDWDTLSSQQQQEMINIVNQDIGNF
ncbi:MAG TPA: hypothetical protein PLU64_02420 [Saprospiraceae bacterium]|nr:hypothetical protein [Saprospiraceae bacterium]